jgi:hypothetical protein
MNFILKTPPMGSGFSQPSSQQVNLVKKMDSQAISPCPSPVFESNPNSTMTTKLIKANIDYDISNLSFYHDSETIMKLMKSEIENDKNSQRLKNTQTEFKYQFKPKIFITEIETNEFTKAFVPYFINPYGFVHTCLKLGPLVCSFFG